MSEQQRNKIELVRRAGADTQETLRGVTQAEIDDYMFDEFTLVPDLNEEQKESFREYPEGFVRNYLQEIGFPYPVEDVALRCSASPPFSDDCLFLRADLGETETPPHFHIGSGKFTCAIAVK